MKKMTTLRINAIAFSLIILTAGSSLAGPPLATDDAATPDIGTLEVELNGSWDHDTKKANGVSTTKSASTAEMKFCSGLYKDLGISLAIPYTLGERIKENGQLIRNSMGLGDMTVELKYAFAEFAGITFAAKPSLILPSGRYGAGLSEGRWQVGGFLIATREFDEGSYTLHANLGYEHHDYRTKEAADSTRSDLWSGSLAGEIRLCKGLFVVADLGLSTTADKTTTQLSAYALGGARYEINDHLSANAGVKLGMSGPEDDLSALYGIALKF